ncbi:MAG TPA: hypothetical protein PKA64_00320 [Myxococcota bacterium]|nr:hypothetical protein [Myxococcota bacterium]
MLILWLPLAAATAPGDPIDLAAAVHVSQAGLNHLAAGVAGVLPTGIDIQGVSTSFACDPSDADPLAFSLPSLHAGLTTDAVRIQPTAGGLHLTIDLGLSLTADDVAVSGSCTFLLRDVDYTCNVQAGAPRPIDLRLDIDIDLDLAPDGAFDATVTALDYTLGPIANPLFGCRRLRDFFDTLSVLGLDSADTATSNPQFFTGLVEGFIDPELEALPAELETALEDALTFLPLTTSVDLLGAPLDVELYATALRIDANGLLIGLGATLDAPWDPTCAYDGEPDAPIPPEGPPLTARGWPALGNTAYGEGALPYDAALFISHDLVEQASYVVWQAGLLCMDVGELSPIPLGTGLLGTMLGDTFRELFPGDGDARLLLTGDAPPSVDFPDDAVVELGLDGLSLDVYAALDARDTRTCSTGIDALATLGVGIDAGALTLDLGIDPATWSFTEHNHELLPEGYSDGLKTGLPSILDGILTPDLLPAIPLPAWQGIGVGGVTTLPAPDGAWQGLFLTLDTAQVEPIVIEGCSAGCDGTDAGLDLGAVLGCSDDAGCGGCSGDTGCEGTGCSQGRGAARVWTITGAIVLALRRRRGR